MKKILKRIAIGAGAVIVLLLVAAGGFYLKFRSETGKMSPLETGQIHDSVYCIRNNFVNVFLFKGRGGYVMVDAGIDADGVLAEMAKLGIRPADVTALFLTHTDSDHTAAAGVLPNAKIYMHRDEEQMINGQNGKFPFIRFHWHYAPYTLLNDNDSLDVDGVSVKVLHMPGHTPGSCSFLMNNSDLTVGDNLSIVGGKIQPFNDFFNMDSRLQASSLAKFPELQTASYVLSAHYGMVKR